MGPGSAARLDAERLQAEQRRGSRVLRGIIGANLGAIVIAAVLWRWVHGDSTCLGGFLWALLNLWKSAWLMVLCWPVALSQLLVSAGRLLSRRHATEWPLLLVLFSLSALEITFLIIGVRVWFDTCPGPV